MYTLAANVTNAFAALTALALLVVLLVFGMKYASAARAARLQSEGDNALHELTTRAIQAQEAAAIQLAEISTRLASLEKLLKDVG